MANAKSRSLVRGIRGKKKEKERKEINDRLEIITRSFIVRITIPMTDTF